MAKNQKLSSKWNVKAGVLNLSIEAREVGASSEDPVIETATFAVSLSDVFGAGYDALNSVGKAALDFGAFTALRNSTGSAVDLDEAKAAIQRRVDAWETGEWGSERESSATAFNPSHALAQAVERASKGAMDASTAAAKLCEAAEATCAANNLGEFSSISPDERAKIRKAVVESIKGSKPAIAAALLQIEAERQAEAAKRKAEAAAKALGEAGDDDGSTL